MEVGEGEATANKAMMATVKMIYKEGVVEDTAGNKAGEAMNKAEVVVTTSTKGDDTITAAKREVTVSGRRGTVEDASRSKDMMAGIKVANTEGAIKAVAMATRDARSTMGDDRKKDTASKSKDMMAGIKVADTEGAIKAVAMATRDARSTTSDGRKQDTASKSKATVAREDASKSKDMVVGTRADPMAVEVTTTALAMPFTMHNRTEAMVTRKVECSVRLCLPLVRTSKISKMRALTSNRWCRVSAASVLK